MYTSIKNNRCSELKRQKLCVEIILTLYRKVFRKGDSLVTPQPKT